MTESESLAGSTGSFRWHDGISPQERRTLLGLAAGQTVWLTGLSGSGKSTVAVGVERALLEAGRPAIILDGDNLRHGLNRDLGLSAEDRAENVRRVGEVAKLFAGVGWVALVPVISPYIADRDKVRASHEQGGLGFSEIYVDTPLDVCQARDPKGLYAKAAAGELKGMTGIDAPYEAPLRPDLHLDGAGAMDSLLGQVLTLIDQGGK
ncbi:MAG TPA: adenylyl-sulfate kinase [Frankiaceae bacterium]|nr:adenylyl-sulfate kinase [Frankiaceae bacterium]